MTLHQTGPFTQPPLVLLPPFPFDSRAWAGVAERLPGAILVDPPGFGASGADGVPSLEEYATALADALADLGIERVVLAGNSMGGYAAMAFAELYPERVAGLGLFGTKATEDSEEASARRLSMAGRAEAGASAVELVGGSEKDLLAPTASPEVVAQVRGWLAEAPADGIAWAQRAMASRPDRLAVLDALEAPGVVVHGSDDPLMGADLQRPMAAALGTTVETLTGRGHLLPVEDPDACAEILRRLLPRCEG